MCNKVTLLSGECVILNVLWLQAAFELCIRQQKPSLVSFASAGANQLYDGILNVTKSKKQTETWELIFCDHTSSF